MKKYILLLLTLFSLCEQDNLFAKKGLWATGVESGITATYPYGYGVFLKYKALKLYPNPASNWLSVELPQNIDVNISGCAVTNLLGQTIYQTMKNNRIDVSRLQKDVYILSL